METFVVLIEGAIKIDAKNKVEAHKKGREMLFGEGEVQVIGCMTGITPESSCNWDRSDNSPLPWPPADA